MSSRYERARELVNAGVQKVRIDIDTWSQIHDFLAEADAAIEEGSTSPYRNPENLLESARDLTKKAGLFFCEVIEEPSGKHALSQKGKFKNRIRSKPTVTIDQAGKKRQTGVVFKIYEQPVSPHLPRV